MLFDCIIATTSIRQPIQGEMLKGQVMGNGGWHGTDEEWSRLEAPLKALDDEIDRFAKEGGYKTLRNYKDWPSRSIYWNYRGIRCDIQIHIDDETDAKLQLSISAWYDKAGERHSKYERIFTSKPFEEVIAEIYDILILSRDKLTIWSFDTTDFTVAVF